MIFESLAAELKTLVLDWEQKLSLLSESAISVPKNNQNRSIKMIVGHMIDSASNNTHRTVHLQYQQSPLEFPNYATHGNNDRWIAIQNYKEEEWETLIQLWKYSHLHYIHIIQNIATEDLGKEWLAEAGKLFSLKALVEDFPRHFDLHIAEIEELLNQQ